MGGETAMRRRLLAAVFLIAGAVGAGYYFWSGRVVDAPQPPSVPEKFTDPPVRTAIESKRQAVLTAPRSGTAWGELAMAFDAHDAPAEAQVCYRRALDLDPTDARWPFLLAEQLNWRGITAPDKEEAMRLYQRAADCPPRSPNHRAVILLSQADLLTELGRGN